MHPEITAQLAAIRYSELLAEADHARRVAAARGRRVKARSGRRRRLSWKVAPAR